MVFVSYISYSLCDFLVPSSYRRIVEGLERRNMNSTNLNIEYWKDVFFKSINEQDDFPPISEVDIQEFLDELRRENTCVNCDVGDCLAFQCRYFRGMRDSLLTLWVAANFQRETLPQIYSNYLKRKLQFQHLVLEMLSVEEQECFTRICVTTELCFGLFERVTEETSL